MSKLAFDVISDRPGLQHRVVEGESGELMLYALTSDNEYIHHFIRYLDEYETDFIRSAYAAGVESSR